MLTPFKDKSFEFLVFQGGAIDRVMRLLASGIEVQKADGSFVRFIANDPALPQEYTEFRRIATHLRWLNDSRKLFVRTLVFEEPLAPDLKAQPSAADIINADKEGLQWRRNADGSFRLVRLQAGRVVVMNVDPMSLDNQARYELNERIKRNPGGFVFLDVRPDGPGGNFPIRGAIKLRSMLQMLAFVASGARAVPEFDVAPTRAPAPSARTRVLRYTSIFPRFRRLRPSPRSSLKGALTASGTPPGTAPTSRRSATSSRPLSVTSRGRPADHDFEVKVSIFTGRPIQTNRRLCL